MVESVRSGFGYQVSGEYSVDEIRENALALARSFRVALLETSEFTSVIVDKWLNKARGGEVKLRRDDLLRTPGLALAVANVSGWMILGMGRRTSRGGQTILNLLKVVYPSRRGGIFYW